MTEDLNNCTNSLYLSGIRTVAGLHGRLGRAGFKITTRTVEKKLKTLRSGELCRDNRENNQRPRIVTQADDERIEEALNQDPELNASELQAKLKLPCCPRTINNHLRELGYRYIIIRKTPMISDDQRDARIDFSESHLRDHKWKRTFFLDEATFRAFSARKNCYQRAMNRVLKNQPKHPQGINMLGMISHEGPSRLILFEANLTGSLFRRYLKLLNRDAEKLYPSKNYRIQLR